MKLYLGEKVEMIWGKTDTERAKIKIDVFRRVAVYLSVGYFFHR